MRYRDCLFAGVRPSSATTSAHLLTQACAYAGSPICFSSSSAASTRQPSFTPASSPDDIYDIYDDFDIPEAPPIFVPDPGYEPLPRPPPPSDDATPRSLSALDAIVAFDKVRTLLQRHDIPGAIRAATTLLDLGDLPAIIEVYELLIPACIRAKDAIHAIRLYNDMELRGVKPTVEIYYALLKTFSKMPMPGVRKKVVDEMKERWMPLSEQGEEWVLLGRICDGDVEGVMETIQEWKERGEEVGEMVYFKLGMKMVEFGDFKGGMGVLEDMEHRIEVVERLQKGRRMLDPDRWNRLWFDLLMTASSELRIEPTKFVWDRAVTPGLIMPDSGVYTQVLHTAARHGSPQLAESAAACLPPSEPTYAAILEANARAGNTSRVFALLSEMRQRSFPATWRTTRALIPFIPPKLAFELLRATKPADPEAVHLAISAFIYIKDLESAFDVYKSIPSLLITRAIPEIPNTDTFNILLSGCAQHGERDLAMYVATEMRDMKQARPWVKPDRRTYESLIAVCLSSLQKDRWKDAILYYEEMKNFGLVPVHDMYRDLVLRCAAEGELEKGLGILKDMEDVGWNLTVTKTALYKKWRSRGT